MSFPATGCLFGLKNEGLRDKWFAGEQFNKESTGVRGWFHLALRTREPLMKEPGLPPEGDYEYPFLLRESGKHFLLLGLQAALVDALFDFSNLRSEVFCPHVGIGDLVASLIERREHYALSAVFARVEGSGQSLRTVSFYGNDVGDARLFKDALPSLQAYRVSLRRVETSTEVLSIGTRGEVSCHFSGNSSLRRLDAGLKFLAELQYIDWSRRLALSLR